MVSLVTFSHYVLAVNKRLMAHYGITQVEAKRLVEHHRQFVFEGYQRQVASDRIARLLADRYFQTRSSRTANPARYAHRGVPIVVEKQGAMWTAWAMWADGRKLFAGRSTHGEADAAKKAMRFIDVYSSRSAAASECPCEATKTEKSPCSCAHENPIAPQAKTAILLFGAAVATAVGVNLLLDALKAKTPSLQSDPAPAPLPNFTPQRPEILQVMGPYGLIPRAENV